MPEKKSASIKDWPEDEIPRVRLVEYGGKAFSLLINSQF
jgi:DNA repair protein RadC